MLDVVTEVFDAPVDPCDPGWTLAEVVDFDEADFGEMSAVEAARFVAAADQLQAMVQAQKLRAMQRYRTAAADDEWAQDELAMRRNVSLSRSGQDLALAESLCERLPRTLAALSAGVLDESRARQLAHIAGPLSVAQCGEFEARIYPKIFDKTPSQVARLARTAVIQVDPDGAEARARLATRCRKVERHPAEDGMAWLHAFAPAERVQAAYSRIDTLARGLGADDARSMDERRADVLFDLILGTRQDSVVTHVYVTLTAQTLLGLDTLPGELRGYGPLPAERIRELAFDLKTVWSGVLVDDGGYPKKIAENRYRFSGRLAEYIRLRDRTCTYPACTRPADKADIDHIIPYPRGQTTADNAATECRRHHRLKTHTNWTIHRTRDGTLTWTNPNGRAYTREPDPLIEPDDPPPF